LGLLLAPVMVTIKYMTGWAVVDEPFWVADARAALASFIPAATPAELWVGFGSAYTLALLMMFAGLLSLRSQIRAAASRFVTAGYWVIVAGLCLVVPGDAVHTWTWHQNGLTIPTPGTNPLANTAYAVHMMGMNFVMVGSLLVGVLGLRRKALDRRLAWSFTLIFPSAVFASVTLLPTTPSGALWLFSAIMMAHGYVRAARGGTRLAAA
jgi:hypothetical protein